MQFQAKAVECWSENNIDTIFFGNEAPSLSLLMSSVPGTSDNYMEWNDQSTTSHNPVATIELGWGALRIGLFDEAAKVVGESEFEIGFECCEELFAQVHRTLKLIFGDRLIIEKGERPTRLSSSPDYGSVRYLNLEGKNLTRMPAELAKMVNLKTLKLARNFELNLDSVFHDLAALPNLKELTFSIVGGDIPESLGDLSQLETLSITEIQSTCRLPQSIGKLTRLQSLLVMSDAEIELPESFAELRELANLNFRVAGWNLPAKIFQLAKLVRLDFSNCLIAHFPIEIGRMVSVEEVIFNRTPLIGFAQVLPIVAGMPNLKRLEFNLNPVPREVEYCHNLEELIVSAASGPGDPLRLPDELFRLNQLKSLMLNMNFFETIPDGIGSLKGLTTLSLQESVFDTLPDSIGELMNLEVLNLSSNPTLNRLPESLGKLTKLTTLLLTETPRLNELPSSLQNRHELQIVR